LAKSQSSWAADFKVYRRIIMLTADCRLATPADIEEVLQLYDEYNQAEPLAQVAVTGKETWLISKSADRSTDIHSVGEVLYLYEVYT
jgi:hypothetical protein